MKDKASIIIITLLAFAIGGLGALAYKQQKEIESLTAQNSTAARELESNVAALEITQQVSQSLEGTITELTQSLTDSSAQLDAVNARLRVFEEQALAEAQVKAKAEDQQKKRAELLAELPPPSTQVETNKFGKEEKIFTFPDLLGATGSSLAANAEFTGLYGNRAVFKDANGRPMGYDVSELHPAVLIHLGINAEDAKQKQAAKEAELRQHKLLARQRQLAQAAAERRAAEQRAHLSIMREKATLDERARLEQAEAERLKAEAAVAKANAALQDARARTTFPGLIRYYEDALNNGGTGMPPPPANTTP